MSQKKTLSQAFGEEASASQDPEPTPQAAGPSSSKRPSGRPMRAEAWALDSYSRLMPGTVAPRPPGARSRNAPGSDPRHGAPTWKNFQCSDKLGKLFLSITEAGNLSIMDGETALEQMSIYELPSTKGLLQVFQKEDFIYFSLQVKTAGRAFRARLYGKTKKKATEQCFSCVAVLSQFTTVRKMTVTPVQKQCAGDSTKPQLMKKPPAPVQPTEGLPEEQFSDGTASFCELMSGAASAPFMPLASQQLPSIPSQQLGVILRMYLLDSNFIALVNAVEQELKKILEEPPVQKLPR